MGDRDGAGVGGAVGKLGTVGGEVVDIVVDVVVVVVGGGLHTKSL